jgi:hypothetical protein
VRIELEALSGRDPERSEGSLLGWKSGWKMEARVRIELTHKGFADLSLTTWVPRPLKYRSFALRLRISPAGSRSPSAALGVAHARKAAQLGYRALSGLYFEEYAWAERESRCPHVCRNPERSARDLSSKRSQARNWRRGPESNRRWRFCRPRPYHLATAPLNLQS